MRLQLFGFRKVALTSFVVDVFVFFLETCMTEAVLPMFDFGLGNVHKVEH